VTRGFLFSPEKFPSNAGRTSPFDPSPPPLRLCRLPALAVLHRCSVLSLSALPRRLSLTCCLCVPRLSHDGADCERCWHHGPVAGARARAADAGAVPHRPPRRPVLDRARRLCLRHVCPSACSAIDVHSEMLYEDPKFPERQLAALVLSKVAIFAACGVY
jgi:hypothetical protein